MKKNLLLKVFAVALVALAFISCKKEVQPTGVKLNQTILALETGATANLIATVEPAGAVGSVSWSSSNDGIASVADGVVTAKSAGSATITAKISTFSATCSVTVTDPYVKVASVELDKTSLELTEGDAAQLTATVKPDNATDKTVTWKSSDAKIATVSASGEVVAVAEGKATITATAGDASASCEVAVAKKVIAVESISLNETALELTEGETATLTATVLPENATDKTVTWTSDNTAVATVADGVVTAVAEGTAKITAKAGDASVLCTVTVKKKVIAVESVTLDKTSLELTVGGTGTLTATVKPDNATDKTVTWSCDNTAVATVADGVVTAVAEGTAKVTAKAGDATAVCTVTVKADVVKVTEITINEADFSLAVGETKTLTVTVKPDNASDKSVTWTSDQPGIASVNSNGVVTAVAAGNAKITVKANGGDVSDFVNVTVTAGVVATGYEAWLGTWSVKRGGDTDFWEFTQKDNDFSFVIDGIQSVPLEYNLSLTEYYSAQDDVFVMISDTLETWIDEDGATVIDVFVGTIKYNALPKYKHVPVTGGLYYIAIGEMADDGMSFKLTPQSVELTDGKTYAINGCMYAGLIQDGEYEGYYYTYAEEDHQVYTDIPSTFNREANSAPQKKNYSKGRHVIDHSKAVRSSEPMMSAVKK